MGFLAIEALALEAESAGLLGRSSQHFFHRMGKRHQGSLEINLGPQLRLGVEQITQVEMLMAVFLAALECPVAGSSIILSGNWFFSTATSFQSTKVIYQLILSEG